VDSAPKVVKGRRRNSKKVKVELMIGRNAGHAIFFCLERKNHNLLQLGRATVDVEEGKTYNGRGCCRQKVSSGGLIAALCSR